jgi:polysaccharide pyruvyl transferase WcaK-like protein
VHLPFVFPPFLYREVPRYDGVVTSCGAMFMSKFSSVPSIMMIEALGIASAHGKLSIAYGGEAGKMDRMLAQMCRRYCARTVMIVRNEESRAVLQELGISSQLGADTAWTFEPLGAEFGETTLRSVGWDRVQPVVAICPNNPFWWPVRPSLLKAGARAVTNAYEDSHYQSIYFHESGARAKEGYQRYVASLAGTIEVLRKERGIL